MNADFLFVSDDKYTDNLGLCTYTVMHNMCPNVEKVRIFVMDCGITPEHQAQLNKQAARFDNAEIIFYNIEKLLDEVVPKVPNNWHRAIYGRLFLDKIAELYPDMERLVYLDCDILVNKPLTELFEMDMQGNIIAAVVDCDAEKRKAELGIPADSLYINSGVLLVDVAKWIEFDTSRKVIDYINNFPEKMLYPDQDAINYILQGKILKLPVRFNMMWMICDYDIPKMVKHTDLCYTEEELMNALHDGDIIHYAGHDMWSMYGVTPEPAKVFRKYKKLSDWSYRHRKFHSVKEFFLWAMLVVSRKLRGV